MQDYVDMVSVFYLDLLIIIFFLSTACRLKRLPIPSSTAPPLRGILCECVCVCILSLVNLLVWKTRKIPNIAQEKFLSQYFFFGCIGSLLLRAGFLQLRRAGWLLMLWSTGSRCAGFSSGGTWALERAGLLVVARWLQGAGSVVVAHGLSCSAACGIFPYQGPNPCPLHWQADS